MRKLYVIALLFGTFVITGRVGAAQPAPTDRLTSVEVRQLVSRGEPADHARLARQLAQAGGRSHQTIPVTEKFFAEFPELARRTVYTTDGGLDVIGSVEVFVNRFARELAPVRMTGNYGSEILRRNVAFKPMPLAQDIFAPACYAVPAMPEVMREEQERAGLRRNDALRPQEEGFATGEVVSQIEHESQAAALAVGAQVIAIGVRAEALARIIAVKP